MTVIYSLLILVLIVGLFLLLLKVLKDYEEK